MTYEYLIKTLLISFKINMSLEHLIVCDKKLNLIFSSFGPFYYKVYAIFLSINVENLKCLKKFDKV